MWRIKRALNEIQWFLQKIFRKNHTSDIEKWSPYSFIAKYAYKKIKAFRYSNLHGHPFAFSEYDEHAWRSKEEYDKAKEAGDVIGGEEKKWLETIDEILFALDYVIRYDNGSEKKRKAFIKEWNLIDVYAKDPKYKKFSYWYRDDKDLFISSGEKISDEEMKEKNYTLEKTNEYYYNSEAESEYMNRAQNGFKLFGIYFMNLWD